jgi:hypothetical protein
MHNINFFCPQDWCDVVAISLAACSDEHHDEEVSVTVANALVVMTSNVEGLKPMLRTAFLSTTNEQDMTVSSFREISCLDGLFMVFCGM